MTTLYILFLLVALLVSSGIFIALLWEFIMRIFRGELEITESDEE